MGKKTPQNAFYFYMKDLQKEYSRDGRTPSMKEMAEIASESFKALPRDKKNYYETMAKEAKTVRRETQEGRFTSDNVPIAQIMAEEQELEREKSRMISEVVSFVCDSTSIEDTPIYIISFNILVATRECHYYPNEVGLVKYTLRDGIQDSYHCFINPGQIPPGYSSLAKEHSLKTHQIPFIMFDFELAETDYTHIFKEIIKFVKGFEGKKIIYCREDQLEQTQSCFQWLTRVTEDKRYADNIYIADLGMLFSELLAIQGIPFPAAYVFDKLTTSTYDYSLNTRCDFHEDQDSCYCALAFSRKMCFILSDNLCPIYKLKLTGSHLPERFGEGDVAEENASDEATGMRNSNPPDISQLSLMNSEEAEKFANADSDSSDDEVEFQPAVKPKKPQNPEVITPSNKLPNFLYSDLEFPPTSCGGIGRGKRVRK